MVQDLRTEPNRTEPNRTEPNRTEPNRTEPNRTEPNRTEPNRTEPNRTEPNRTEPNRTEPNRTEPNRTESILLSHFSWGVTHGGRGGGDDPRRRRGAGSRPFPAARLAATVLVLGLLLLGSTPAQAQTARILVSNAAQGDDSNVSLGGDDHAQLFSTGANTGTTTGWVMTSLEVIAENANDFDVDICEAHATTEFPTATCTTLRRPGSFAIGRLEFTHPNLLLDASANYLVVFKQDDTGSVTLDSTTSNGEDGTGLTDWSIKDKFDLRSSGAWTHKSGTDEAIQITINGHETPANQEASGQPEIRASAEGAPYLFAETTGIRDANGLPHKTAGVANAAIGTGASGRVEFVYSYQWIRVDGMTETNVGTDSDVYHLVDADYGTLIEVDVSFTDRHGYAETVTSDPFRPVRGAADPLLIPTTLVGNTGQSNTADASITEQYAQGFTLGVHGQGYELSSVSIELAAVPTDLTISLWIADHADKDSTLESKLYDFKNPAPFAVGANEFTAPPGVLLHQNIQYAIVLSGFTSLSIKETTSDAEDAGGEPGAELKDTARVRDLGETGRWGTKLGGIASSAVDRETGTTPNTETPVLRLDVAGSQRSSGILASTYGQTASGDQEIISLGDRCCMRVDVGAADRYLIRGVSWNADDTTSYGGGVTNPYELRDGSPTGDKLFGLFITRNIAGVPEWSAPHGATVAGGSDNTYFFSIDFDAFDHIGSGTRRGHVLTRAHGTQSNLYDTPFAPGMRFAEGGDVDIPQFLAAILGEPLHALVQNLGQTDNSFLQLSGGNAKVLSQGFTTGPDARGYALQGIGFNIEGSDNSNSIAQVPDDAASVSVAVYSADADGKPDAKLFDLVSPTEYAPASLSFFEAPAGTTLAANTSYVLVWTRLGGTWHRLQRTSSASEDAGALTGFSIANSSYRGADLANLSVVSGSNVPEIAVYTDRDLSPPERVTAFDLHSDNSDPKGIWGNDDTFWVANDGSGATDKLYAYNRSDGARDSSSDFDNLNGASNNDVRGICSDGTTMFVADSADNKVYAYKMSDTTADSTKDVSLDSDNDSAHALSCDRTHLWVADDTNDHNTSKIFVYLRSDGSHASTLDIPAGTLSPSTTDGSINNHRPSGMWSTGTTLFIADHVDDKIYAYTLSDRTRDDDKNLDLDAANTDPEGLWFDGRVLWVVDDADDTLYVYDLPGAQPDNSPASGDPTVTGTLSQGQTLTADVSGITDATDGLDNVFYHYQWIRDDGTDVTELDGETGPTYTTTADDAGNNIRVRVVFNDDLGNPEYPRYSPQVTVVQASNTAPVFTDTAPVTRSVAENTVAGQNIGTPVAATDSDTTDSLTYSLGGTDVASFDIDTTDGQLQTDAALDYETKDSYEVEVSVTDATATVSITVTISVTDVNEQPATPAAPTVARTAGTTNSLTVSWTAPGLNGGPALTGYNLQYRTGGGSWTTVTPSGTGTTATIGSLSAGTAYEVQVQALNGETPSAWSPSGTGTTIAAPTIVPVPATTVPNAWGLIPSGLSTGDQFRLLFIPSTGIDATSAAIADYNTHVQDAAAAATAHADIQAHSATFRVVASTEAVDARDNTGTTGTGVAIYWLDGAKVADDNADFYDGSWDEEATGRRETGLTVSLSNTWEIWTGSTADGTESVVSGTSHALGNTGSDPVRVGHPNHATHGPLSGDMAALTDNKAVYALSGVFVVDAPAGTNSAPVFTDTPPVTRSVAENSAVGTNVGTPVAATDTNTSDTLTYSLGGTDAASFDIVTTDGQLQTKAGVTYDYETKSSYSVDVSVTDDTATASVTVIITVTDVAEQPDTPAAPTVAATANTTTSLDVSWTVPGRNGGPALTGYTLQYRTGSGSWTPVTHSGTGTTATLTGLTAGTAYEVQVQALNGETPSAWSPAGTGTTAGAVPPPVTTVPHNWGLIPSGLGSGTRFRLLFATSTTRDASSTAIAAYNTFVQGRAAAGHTAIQAYSTHFRVVGSTAAVDAHDNTATTGTGVAIYWLGGNKVADNYADFYDGSWDDETNATDESGSARALSADADWPFTGSNNDGTAASSDELGSSTVRVGKPATPGNGPLLSNTAPANTDTRPFYALSQVFTVGSPPSGGGSSGGRGGGSGGGGGGGGPTCAADIHGNSAAQATDIALATETAGALCPAADVDYFTVTAPGQGLLFVETTGGVSLRGTLWQAGAQLASGPTGSSGQDGRLGALVAAGDVVVAVASHGGATGAYDLVLTFVRGVLENPGAASFQSGVGVLSGWVCDADLVEIAIAALPAQVAGYGTERLDTAGVCGDTDNGFGLLFNWNRLADGEHPVVAYVDGVELAQATVTVTTLGEEFLRGAVGECVVEDFPRGGATVRLAWQQNSQNFVIAEGSPPVGGNTGSTAAVEGVLENPGPNSFQSGVGVLSGWVCAADTVEIALGDFALQPAAYGTERLDTAGVCGDTDNGFGLLFNWNRLGDGEHEVVAYVDEAELGRATVRVTTLGAEFVRGAEGACVVEDFPLDGQTVLLEWQQNSQNFVITEVD